MKNSLSDDAFMAEGLGLYRKQSQGWYTEAMVRACRELGKSRRLAPILGSHQCPYVAAKREVHFFLGVDPAPAQGKKSDDGSMVGVRAVLLPGRSGDMTSDWQKDFVYARRLRNKDADDWAGIIHEKHADFGFDGIGIDLGGGGQWIGPALQRTRQKINGDWVTTKPILPLRTNAMEGQPLYFLLSRGEDVLKEEGGLWHEELRNARGDDVLKDLANTLFQQQVQKCQVAFPAPEAEWNREEIKDWPEERLWALKMLEQVGWQLTKMRVATNPDGTWKTTANRARQFYSEAGKDDFHDAARNALLAFEVWLLTWVEGLEMGRDGNSGECGMGFG